MHNQRLRISNKIKYALTTISYNLGFEQNFFLVYFQRGHPRGHGSPMKPPSGMPSIEIQQQILRIPGPIVSLRSFLSLAPPKFRKVNSEEYMKAIDGLEGYYGKQHKLKIKGQGKKSQIFVKKIPEEVVHFDLCSAEEYGERYKRPGSRFIGERVQRQLVAQGILTEQQLRGENPFEIKH